MDMSRDTGFSGGEADARDESSTDKPEWLEWTPDKQHLFLMHLAQTGSVRSAANLVGMSSDSAYGFRNRTGSRNFARAWDAALCRVRARIADQLVERALHGQTETVTDSYGEKVHRHRYDNRLGLALLARLDADAGISEREADGRARIVGRFEEFVGLAVSDPAGALAFLKKAGKVPHEITVNIVEPDGTRSTLEEFRARPRSYPPAPSDRPPHPPRD
jgi:hypothetical protein